MKTLKVSKHLIYSEMHTVSLNTFKLYSHCSQKCLKHNHGCKKTVRTDADNLSSACSGHLVRGLIETYFFLCVKVFSRYLKMNVIWDL